MTPEQGQLPFIESAALRERLDLLHHLLEFGRQIVAIRGPEGSGKSRLLEAWAQETGPRWKVIRLSGDEPTDTNSMLRMTSDAAGRFRFLEAAHAGEWYIGAYETGALIEPRLVKLTDESHFHLRVVVERPDPLVAITGTVSERSRRLSNNGRLGSTSYVAPFRFLSVIVRNSVTAKYHLCNRHQDSGFRDNG